MVNTRLTEPVAAPETPLRRGRKHIILHDFRVIRPEYEASHEEAARWLAEAHARAEATRTGGAPEGCGDEAARRMRRLLERFACGPDRIARRGHALADFRHARWNEMRVFRLAESPSGAGHDVRADVFGEVADAAFEAFYAGETEAPDEIV